MLPCSNYGKKRSCQRTCHNKKRKNPIMHVVPIKIVKLVIKVTAQHVKPSRVPLRYPCIICFSS
jgi:hypothetical protein